MPSVDWPRDSDEPDELSPSPTSGVRDDASSTSAGHLRQVLAEAGLTTNASKDDVRTFLSSRRSAVVCLFFLFHSSCKRRFEEFRKEQGVLLESLQALLDLSEPDVAAGLTDSGSPPPPLRAASFATLGSADDGSADVDYPTCRPEQ